VSGHMGPAPLRPMQNTGASIMPVTISVIPEESRMDLSFEGNLDVSVWQDVCDACSHPPPDVKTCIVDLTAVGRVFDSGVAVLGLLYKRMRRSGSTVVFLSDDFKLRNRVAAIASPLWHQPSLIA
jgi:ABC-type transporter Mla MlaB component